MGERKRTREKKKSLRSKTRDKKEEKEEKERKRTRYKEKVMELSDFIFHTSSRTASIIFLHHLAVANVPCLKPRRFVMSRDVPFNSG